MSNSLPAFSFLKIPASGSPYLEGLKCSKCSAIFTDTRTVCAKCGGRDTLVATRLSEKGKVYSYSIVHRTFPGIKTPFISAIVDLEGGGTLKGNIIGIEPTPENVKFGMDVKIVYQDALGRKDKEGNSYTCFFFQPAA